jgi:hypothetical protein
MKRRLRIGLGIAAALSLLSGLAAQAQTPCRQALALGLDISGSVDRAEYSLQMEGLAAALTDPSVLDAFMSMPSAPIRIYIYEWAGLGTQRVLADWTEIDAEEKLAGIAQNLRNQPRRPREVATALGNAMLFGADALNRQAECWKRTLDISGDGQSNIGPRPREVRFGPQFNNITINALVIGADAPSSSDRRQVEIAELSSYFRTEVVLGPDAFVMTALGFEDYQAAMTRKLLRELEVLAIGKLDMRP